MSVDITLETAVVEVTAESIEVRIEAGNGPPGPPAIVPAASETVAGIAEIATPTEVAEGIDPVRFVTPLTLAQRLATVLGDYQPLDSDLSAIAALATTAFGRGLLTLVNAEAVRAAIGSRADNGPDPFVFANQTNTSLSAIVQSNTVLLSGPNGPSDTWPITIDAPNGSNPQIQVNGGTWVDGRSEASVVRSGDVVTVRMLSGNAQVQRVATVRIGNRTATWSVTSAAWSPAAIGAKTWVEPSPTRAFADAGGVTPCGNGDTVYTLVDQAGGNPYLQATAGKRPTLRQIAGKWCLETDGVDDAIQRSFAQSGITRATIAVRFSLLSAGSFPMLLTGFGGELRCNSDSRRVEFDGIATDPTAITLGEIYTYVCVIDTTAPSQKLKIYRGNTLVASADTFSAFSTSSQCIGARLGGGSYFAHARLYSAVACDQAVSDADRANLIAYLEAL